MDAANQLTHKAGWLVVSQVGCRGPRGQDEAQGLHMEQFDKQLDAFRRSAEVNNTPKEGTADTVASVVAAILVQGSALPGRGTGSREVGFGKSIWTRTDVLG